jgi:Holliday junction DNA helicase RuvA
MIGYLSGIIKSKQLNSLIVDVQGVGYEVFVPLFSLSTCKLAEKKEFFIYTHVREDTLSLFGFTNKEDKSIFMQLLSVSGVGPKTALNILSASNGSSNIVRAIQNADVDFFTSIKGIGKKSGQRIIVDLKPKLGGLKDLEFESQGDLDLVEALTGLGFSKDEVKLAMRGVDKTLALEEKIKQALKNSHGKNNH